MNAHELDEWIDNSPYTEREAVIQLLRQQQSRIEELQKALGRALDLLGAPE